MREARRRIVPVTTIHLWLDRHAQSIELGARMLAAVGTPTFFEYGRQIYGEPTAPLRYVPLTALELAQSVLDTITQLALTFSVFTGRLSMEPIVEVADKLLESVPIVRMPIPGENA